MNETRSNTAVVYVPFYNQIYAVGGDEGIEGKNDELDSCEFYETNNLQWTNAA